MVQSPSSKVRMQALRLLVNLSTNDDYMLRVMTLLANLVCSAHRLKISGSGRGLDARASEPDSMFSSIFGSDNRADVIEHIAHLMESHQAEDIRVKARMVHA